jgi:hypothetical protein
MKQFGLTTVDVEEFQRGAGEPETREIAANDVTDRFWTIVQGLLPTQSAVAAYSAMVCGVPRCRDRPRYKG